MYTSVIQRLNRCSDMFYNCVIFVILKKRENKHKKEELVSHLESLATRGQ